jgi:2-polyprenyl-3-methyl-5-hydroxy-6-metoxy-1,4-benzoquinol methylase
MVKYNKEYLANASERTVDFKSIIAPVIRNLLGKIDNKRVLDIGCGTGRFARLAASMNAKVTAIDKGIEQINQAKHATRTNMANIHFLVGDLCGPNKIGTDFDIVFLMFVVLDTPSPEELSKLVKASVKTMRPGATLLLADVHPHNFKRQNSVEFVHPIDNGTYFSEGCPVSSKVLMLDGNLREFKPSYHYSLSLIINTFCSEGLYLKNLTEPFFREDFPTHIVLEFTKTV